MFIVFRLIKKGFSIAYSATILWPLGVVRRLYVMFVISPICFVFGLQPVTPHKVKNIESNDTDDDIFVDGKHI